MIVGVFNILTNEMECHEIDIARRTHRKLDIPVPDDALTFVRWIAGGFEGIDGAAARRYEKAMLGAFQAACGVHPQ